MAAVQSMDEGSLKQVCLTGLALWCMSCCYGSCAGLLTCYGGHQPTDAYCSCAGPDPVLDECPVLIQCQSLHHRTFSPPNLALLCLSADVHEQRHVQVRG